MSLSNNFPAIKPSLMLDFAGNKALDPRITFTRSTTATYYDGVTTAKAEENLLTYSQEFDNAAWGKLACSVTANSTAAPDGTTTADTLTADGTSSAHRISQGTSLFGANYTISFYAKAGTNNFVQVFTDFTNNDWANFDIGTGATGSKGSATGATTITSVGGGWYRCTMVTGDALSRNVNLGIISSATAARNETNTLATTVFLWGAQLEQRNSVTAYTATTTQAITNYIPVLQTAAAGVPRFDHNPVTDESLGLLIEEQRTNLQIRSQEFDNSEWNTAGVVSVSANVAVAPDGTQTADKLIATSSVVGQFVGGLAISTATTAHTFTAYLKAGEYSWSILYVTGANVGVYFNLSNGTIGSTFVGAPTSSSITSVGNGWYRCSITFTATATTGCRIYVRTSDGQGSFAGNGFSGIFIWGAQLEAGAFATSYIPTVASTVTRNADAASMTGTNFSSWYSAGEGTMYAEARSTSLVAAGNGVFGITDGTISNRFGVYAISTNNAVSGYMTTNGTLQADMPVNNAAASGAQFRSAFAYKVNDFAFSANGAAALTDTSGTISVANQAVIGSIYITASNSLNGAIKKIAYYPLRVTNAQLQALTS